MAALAALLCPMFVSEARAQPVPKVGTCPSGYHSSGSACVTNSRERGVGVLGAAAAMPKESWDNSKLGLEVSSRLLDEKRVSWKDGVWCPEALINRQNTIFPLPSDGRFTILVYTIVKGYRLDIKQQPNLEGYILLATHGGLSYLGEYPPTKEVNEWKDRPISNCPNLGPDKVATDLRLEPDDVLFLQFLEVNSVVARESAFARQATLRSIIHDKISGAASVTEIPITFE
jgi:hypothetical protein